MGVLFTFPSRYSFTIGHCLVFSLSRWSSILPAGFLVSCRTQDQARASFHFAYGTLTLYRIPSHVFLLFLPCTSLACPITPVFSGLGSSAFARHYLRNRSYFLFLQVLRCFTSLRLALFPVSTFRLTGSPIRISAAPFACLLLTAAFRRLLRPSSPDSA